MKGKTKRAAFAAADAVNVILVILSAIFGVFSGDGALWKAGWGRFVFFTVDSNVIAALFLAAALPFKIRRISSGKPLPRAVSSLCHIGACAVAVTFLTVLLFLGPVLGYGSMYAGNNLMLHMICPVLAVASFVFDCESEDGFPFALTVAGVLPTLVYGAVYFIEVMVKGPGNGGWSDFYGFNAGGRWYISAAVMLAASYAVSAALWAAQRAVFRRRLKDK